MEYSEKEKVDRVVAIFRSLNFVTNESGSMILHGFNIKDNQELYESLGFEVYERLDDDRKTYFEASLYMNSQGDGPYNLKRKELILLP